METVDIVYTQDTNMYYILYYYNTYTNNTTKHDSRFVTTILKILLQLSILNLFPVRNGIRID